LLLRTGVIRQNIRRLRHALPGVDIYYAVKANNHPAIIQTVRDEGYRFDVSSAREVAEVLAVGAGADDTIHTNPVKSPAEFAAAVSHGVRIFVADNIAELDKFARFGDAAGVLLRFRTPIGGSVVNLSYKFGADPADVPAMLDRIRQLGLRFKGFCFHVGSQCTEPDIYVNAIATAADLIALAKAKGLTVELLDIGGGFPIPYTGVVPSIEAVGRKITAALKRRIDPSIRIVCEPGRYICGPAATLFASVIGASVRDGVKWYYLDDGLYGSFSGRLYDSCSYRILTHRNSRWEKAVLAGPTCDSFDVIYRECLMPPLDIGDILMFPSMGAYCSVSATSFNGLEPARVIVVDW
jgi:ornithine decarboxylase